MYEISFKLAGAKQAIRGKRPGDDYTKSALEERIKAVELKFSNYCDGYSGYKKLEGVTLCGCLVHVKRKFHEAWKINESNEYAKLGEAYIQKLFSIEHKADAQNYSIEERFDLRQKEYLCSFLKDGRIQLSNNLAEQSVKMVGNRSKKLVILEHTKWSIVVCTNL